MGSSQIPRYKQVNRRVIKGSFGEVCRYHDRTTDSDVAMKTILFRTTKNGLPSSVLREISVLKELEHENVVRLLDVIYTPNNITLSFEWMENDLGRLIEQGPLDPSKIKSFLSQILQGVCYCHSQKVLHRDLKPHNLLIDSLTNKVKLADFGLARTFDAAPPEYSTDVGTVNYRAPEVLLNMRQITTAVDIWSAGCIFAEMVTGRPLFNGIFKMDVMMYIISILSVPTENEWPGLTAACRDVCRMDPDMLLSDPLPDLANVVPLLEEPGIDLLSKMLCFVPGSRITAHDALQHPYLKNS